MKKIIRNTILLLLLIAICEKANAQWQWAQSAGGSDHDDGISTATDASGNFYMACNFRSGSMTFGTYTLTNTGPVGTTDVCLVKYDPTGSVLWAKKGGGTYADAIKKVCVDSKGNIYMAGYYYSTGINFGGNFLTNTTNNTVYSDIFIVKYDSSGNVLWLKGASGGTLIDDAYGVSVDTAGNVVVTGKFTSPSLTFGSYTLTNSGSGDAFIAKYNSSGNVVWAKKAGDTGNDVGQDIASMPNGDVCVAGYFNSPSITFGGTTLNNDGAYDVFLTKYDASGNVLWSKKSSGGPNNEFPDYVTVDKSGNAYIAGAFISPTVMFGSVTLNNTDNSGSTKDMFIAKYDSGGTALWAKSAGGMSSDEAYSLYVDLNGSIFVTGNFVSTSITFGSTVLTNAGTNSADIFITKYDASGNPLWAVGAGGSGYDLGWGISVNNAGSIFVTGDFISPTINFGSTTLTNAGLYDVFIAVLGVATSANDEILSQSRKSINLFPNPFSTHTTLRSDEFLENVMLTIENCLGQRVKHIYNISGNEIIFNRDNLPNGLYSLRVMKNNEVIATEKIVIASD